MPEKLPLVLDPLSMVALEQDKFCGSLYYFRHVTLEQSFPLYASEIIRAAEYLSSLGYTNSPETNFHVPTSA